MPQANVAFGDTDHIRIVYLELFVRERVDEYALQPAFQLGACGWGHTLTSW